jgi:large subunit ribosomal protein L25
MPKAPAPTDTLTIDVRPHAGTTAARAVRRAGSVPGVLYGHGAPTPIAIRAKALEDLLTLGGKAHILDATIAGVHDSVLLRDVQRDPISRRPIHADFQRVSKGEAITATVAIVVTGTSAAVKDGAILDIISRTIDLKGPADKIPDSISVDIGEAGLHTHVNAGSLILPAGFTLVTPAETVIISIEAPRTGHIDEAVTPAAGTEAPVATANA